MISTAQIRKKAVGNEFDYVFLSECLKNYSKPRDKISSLLKKGDIVRVKKGLYVFGEEYLKGLISKEILANLIYGPSYVSLEYALGFYGLIPERVETVTSVTTQRNRQYSTPLGVFTYRKQNIGIYSLGADQVEINRDRSFLIASKEKALMDKLWADNHEIKTKRELEEYLFDDLRLDENEFSRMNFSEIVKISKLFKVTSIRMLANYLQRKKGRK